MKKCLVILSLLLAVAGVRAALPEPDLIAQIHFAGAQKISAAAHFAAFTNQFCSAEAVALRAQTANKLAAWLPGWLQTNVGATVPGGAAKLRPLFDDLQTAEWFLEARAAANERPEVALAIKLDAARAQLWQANLKPFFPAASFTSSGGWLIFDAGTGAKKINDRLAQKISAPPNGWCSADVNWPRLAQWYPKLKELGLPETQFAVSAPDDNLLINGKFFFPENLALNLENWRVPTNTLHSPFDSFTAVRGFSAWLKSQPWAEPLALAPEPNQLFVWALPQIPFQTFAAVPVPDAAGALAQANARLLPIFTGTNGARNFLMPFTLNLTNNEITWTGVPFVAPFLQAVKEPAGQFLFGGFFPNMPGRRSLPPELFERLAAKNLVYYHWEITAQRLGDRFDLLPQLTQLGLMLTNRKQLDSLTPAGEWAKKIGPTLGNSVTEITQTGPAEMTFTRKAPGVLTAGEMLALANWLEADNFPGCDLKLPPRQPRRPHPKPPGTPPAAAPAPAPAH
jgi:hypothetical protein